jgi:hypothetical protein
MGSHGRFAAHFATFDTVSIIDSIRSRVYSCLGNTSKIRHAGATAMIASGNLRRTSPNGGISPSWVSRRWPQVMPSKKSENPSVWS